MLAVLIFMSRGEWRVIGESRMSDLVGAHKSRWCRSSHPWGWNLTGALAYPMVASKWYTRFISIHLVMKLVASSSLPCLISGHPLDNSCPTFSGQNILMMWLCQIRGKERGVEWSTKMLVTKNFKRHVTRNSQLRSIRKSKTRYCCCCRSREQKKALRLPRQSSRLKLNVDNPDHNLEYTMPKYVPSQLYHA